MCFFPDEVVVVELLAPLDAPVALTFAPGTRSVSIRGGSLVNQLGVWPAANSLATFLEKALGLAPANARTEGGRAEAMMPRLEERSVS